MSNERAGAWSQERIADPARLRRLRQLGLLDAPSEGAFDRLTRLTTRLLDVPVALVSLVDEDRQFFTSELGLTDPWSSRRQTPLDHSFCQYTLGRSEPLVIEDARQDPLVWNNRAIDALGVVAYLGIPLVTPDGYTVGSLCAIDRRPRAWTAVEIEELTDLAEIAMAEIARRLRTVPGADGDRPAPATAPEGSGIQSVGLPVQRSAGDSPDLILILDPDGVIRYASPQAERVVGDPRASLLGRAFSSVVEDEGHDGGGRARPASPPVDVLIDRSGTDVWLRTHDGQRRSVVMTAVLLDRAAPERGIVVHLRDGLDAGRLADEPDHSIVQQVLRRHRRSILTSIIDMDGVIRYVSDAATEILGYEPTALVGTPGDDLIHREDLPAIRSSFADGLVRGRQDAVWRYRARHADGSWRWLESTWEEVVGEPDATGVVLTSRDITRRRLGEDAALEAYLRVFMRQSVELVAVINPDQTIRYVSESIEAVLGVRSEEPRGLRISEVIHPDDQLQAQREFAALVSGTSDIIRFETRCRHRDGHWVWLEVTATRLEDQPGLDGIVVNARDVSERKSLEHRLAIEATHDALTGLPNRSLFVDRLRALAEGRDIVRRRVAVMFVDLDDFKRVNDAFGHEAGDTLLRDVAHLLRGQLGRDHTLARFGGDEFTVLIPAVTGIDGAVAIAGRLLRSLDEPFLVNGHAVHVHASIGVAISSAELASPADLLRAADMALYRAKDLRGNHYVAHTVAMDAELHDRMRREEELRLAHGLDQLVVHYQPIVDLTGSRLVGLEALLRWQHPELGLIGPDAFLDIAHATGLIVPIGQWVLREATRQVARWSERSPLSVSVNVAPQQLRRPDFAHSVAEVLQETGLAPDLLRLEITESVTATDGVASLHHLNLLRALGVSLAIDDFGTGESSLASLRRYPIDTIKIDRGFVARADQDPEAAAVVRAVIGVGHALGLTVIAEGVETEGERDLLRFLGCDLAQGFLFGRPMTAEAIETRYPELVAVPAAAAAS